MTPAERANLTVGHTSTTGCGGVTGSAPRVGFPGLCLADAGNGLRNTDFVNGWSSGLHVGATVGVFYSRLFGNADEGSGIAIYLMSGPCIWVVSLEGRVSMCF